MTQEWLLVSLFPMAGRPPRKRIDGFGNASKRHCRSISSSSPHR